METNELLQIISHFTPSLVAQCAKFSEGMSFTNFVQNIENSVKVLACKLIEQAFWLSDCEYNIQRDKRQVRIKDTKKTRKVLTSLGEIVLRRRLYQSANTKKTFFAIDQQSGLEKYTRIESGLKAKLIDCAIDTSYGKASRFFDNNISRQSVFNMCKDVIVDEAPIIADKNAPNIYIEADEDHIHLQNGKPGEVKLVYVHEGRKPICKGRTALVNPRYFVSASDDSDTIWSDVAYFVGNNYSNSCVKILGDGGAWIKESKNVFKGSQFFLDKFHVRQAILNASMGDKKTMRKISTAVKAKNTEELRQLYNNTFSPHQKTTKISRTSLAYLINNIDEISFDNKIKCSAESHVSHVLSSRMSSRPMGWSLQGAERIAKLRAYKFNGGDIQSLICRQAALNAQSFENKIKGYRRVKDDKNNFSNNYLDLISGKVVGYTGRKDEFYQKLHKLL